MFCGDGLSASITPATATTSRPSRFSAICNIDRTALSAVTSKTLGILVFPPPGKPFIRDEQTVTEQPRLCLFRIAQLQVYRAIHPMVLVQLGSSDLASALTE